MKTLLEIKNLAIYFNGDENTVRALNGVDLAIHEGMTLGLVGETGAGKTTLAKGIMRLTPCPPGEIVSGEIFYKEQDLLLLSENSIRDIRGKEISIIFQDPMTSLNPVMTVGDQISEVIQIHNDIPKYEAEEQTRKMLELVGIPPERLSEYPHQFSGGMRQRIVIAISLACRPRLLIADEPTTALDVTIQAQVLEMIGELKTRFNTSILLITHDLGVVAQNCDFVAIMYAGEIIEYGTVREVFHKHSHPYTEGLLGSIPNLVEAVPRLKPIEGLMPDPTMIWEGCSFSPRCRYALSICSQRKPPFIADAEGHKVRCWLYENRREN
jgi:peptide/nickel transport system ATP-binding protein